MARDVLDDIERATAKINSLDKRITASVEEQAAGLIGLQGCGALTAAKIIGETANVARSVLRPVTPSMPASHRFQFGQATPPAGFACREPGNRQLNCALHRIAITQIRLDSPGAATTESGSGLGTPPQRLSAASNAASLASSTKHLKTFNGHRPQQRPRLDIGETHAGFVDDHQCGRADRGRPVGQVAVL
jgi:hypothetical protein